ncbi:MAG: precorrin-4 C(11)-methyltransferase [Bacteroidaceae bacterium]|nr:precorrin-4 C(11)-methyltransferase [Bacteroidaceae bacterium]
MILIVYVTEVGRQLAQRILQELPSCHMMPVKAFSAENFRNSEGIIFIGALGICVRTIVPYIKAKQNDPAVLCVDSGGNYVISVLSGHVGGANELTKRISHVLGCQPVITTQSDNQGLWALDLLAEQYGWQEEHSGGRINHIIFHYVGKKPTVLKLDVRGDKGAQYMERTRQSHVSLYGGEVIPEESLLVAVSPYFRPAEENFKSTLVYHPPVLHLGVGCAHDCDPSDLPLLIREKLHEHNLSEKSIATIDTIPLKADEPLMQALQMAFPWARFVVHLNKELEGITVPNPSEYAQKYIGIPSVSEACALTYGPLLMEKEKIMGRCTIAVSISQEKALGGHVEIVGAGPGDPELVSLRGIRFLQQADLILYAGSLVPEELTRYAKAGCTVRSSASMDLEEQFALMKEFYDKGLLVVRLHTGDPCIYGAIQEQMAYFDQHGMHYHITPGISSFLAAAAELRSQFTIPEKCQTIILTRGEGRTLMPELEKLHLLAAHQSTMCIFLSASLAQQVQDELLAGGYPPETPVAACYKLTWPDQQIYRGQLQNLAQIIADHHLTLTTMIVVGEAIDNREGLSRLYDGHFTHMFRKGRP